MPADRESQVSRQLLKAAIFANLLQYYERTVANQEILDDILKGRYAAATRWVYRSISAKNAVAADCEAFILAACCWIMLDDALLACYDLEHTLELWDELPEFSPYQPFPYKRTTIDELKATLGDEDATDKLERAKAILQQDLPRFAWNPPVDGSTDEASEDESNGGDDRMAETATAPNSVQGAAMP